MRCFDDLVFRGVGIHPRYAHHLDNQHSGSYSLEFASAGTLYHGRDGGRRARIEGPAVFWHHGRHTYQYGPLAAPGWWDHHWVMFQGARGRRLIEHGVEELSDAGWLPVRDGRLMRRRFCDLVALVRADQPRRHVEAVHLLESIVVQLADESAANAATGSSGAVERLVAEVRAEPLRPWDFVHEARRLGISSSQLRRLFGVVAGCPPRELLLRARLRLAGERLYAGARCGELATELGFSDAGHFSRRFARVFGVPPSRWRTDGRS